MREIWCDGSIEGGNPGGWAVGGWICKSGDKLHSKGAVDLGKGPDRTNNQAEYAAVLDAVETMHKLEYTGALTIHSDSQLIVNQLSRKWQCANKELQKYRDRVWAIEGSFKDIRYVWIPRAMNMEADLQSRSLY